jgi:hypothetical protein
MPDPTPPPFRVPDPQERLGAANELIAQFCDPASSLRLGERVTPGWIVERFRVHLDREAAYQVASGWSAPAVYGETAPAVTTALAGSIPWPAVQVGGLWPGDEVGHPVFGVGRVAGFGDEQWPAVLHLVSAGHLLVRFVDDQGNPGPEHWVASTTLTKAPQPANCDPGSPF